MRTLILLPFLFSACSQPAEQAPVAAAAGSIAGLYERVAPGDAIDRVCLTAGTPTRFGLVTAGEGAANCTAKGEVSVEGAKLTLRIDGAPACRIGATTTVTGLTLDAADGGECAYYCGATARLTPGAFTKAGASAVDIRKVVDIAGDPLC